MGRSALTVWLARLLVSSRLDQIVGVGEIRRNTLLRKFGSLDKIASATDDQLRKAGLDARTASEIRKALTRQPA